MLLKCNYQAVDRTKKNQELEDALKVRRLIDGDYDINEELYEECEWKEIYIDLLFACVFRRDYKKAEERESCQQGEGMTIIQMTTGVYYTVDIPFEIMELYIPFKNDPYEMIMKENGEWITVITGELELDPV